MGNIVILFMTDGDAGAPDYEEVKTRAAAKDTVIFTYALGSGAATGVMYQLAQDNKGYCQKVGDGGDLAKAMSSYYSYFAASINAVKPRWVKYNDWITDQELLSACLSVYDTRETPKELLGVVCMDVNVIATLPTLQSLSSYDKFEEAYQEDTKACQKAKLSDEQIQKFRDAVEEGNRCEPDGGTPWHIIGAVVGGFFLLFCCSVAYYMIKKKQSET